MKAKIITMVVGGVFLFCAADTAKDGFDLILNGEESEPAKTYKRLKAKFRKPDKDEEFGGEEP